MRETTALKVNMKAVTKGKASTAGEKTIETKAKEKRRCTAVTQDGEPCQAWARRGSELALCVAHIDGAYGEGVAFYSPTMSREELVALADLGEAAVTLEGEIAIVRILIRRLIMYMNKWELEGMEMLLFAKTVFKGTAAVARLLEKQKAMAEQYDERGAIAQALDELAEEWGLDL